MRLAGIDGCKTGWVAVEALAGEPASAKLAHASDLAALLKRVDFALVDMPIGFVSGPEGRDVEPAMRSALKGKASSVFPTPCRKALAELGYQAALAMHKEVTGKGLPKQTFALFVKMREADTLVRELGQSRLREGHPEVSFAAMAGGPVLSRKRDYPGMRERIALLEAEGLPAKALVEQLPRGKMATDDVLDAAALCWSADRFVRGIHTNFPPAPLRDEMGIEMSVVA